MIYWLWDKLDDLVGGDSGDGFPWYVVVVLALWTALCAAFVHAHNTGAL